MFDPFVGADPKAVIAVGKQAIDLRAGQPMRGSHGGSLCKSEYAGVASAHPDVTVLRLRQCRQGRSRQAACGSERPKSALAKYLSASLRLGDQNLAATRPAHGGDSGVTVRVRTWDAECAAAIAKQCQILQTQPQAAVRVSRQFGHARDLERAPVVIDRAEADPVEANQSGAGSDPQVAVVVCPIA